LFAIAIFASGKAVFAQVLTPVPSTKVEIETKSGEIENLEKQIAQYESEIGSRRTRQKTLANEIALLDARTKKAQLEIKRLALLIQRLAGEINEREAGIEAAEMDIVRLRGIIAAHLRVFAQEAHKPTVLLFAADGQFSDFFGTLQALETLQGQVRQSLVSLKDQKSDLEEQRQRLAEEKSNNEELKDVQEATREQLGATTRTKQNLLTQTKGEEKRFQELVKVSKSNIEKLKNEIYYLQKIGVTAEQAATLGVLVANRIGIRPAFLIAILEIESRMGANVGTGRYLTDMHPRDHEAFLQITRELGLDPNTTPVSKKPSYGWGGAMGPAQFIPNTWMGYRDRVSTFTGRTPANPWNIEDAFFASAIKLAKDGASSKTASGELAAAKAYIGGSPNCSKSICNYYANLAIDKAADIERTLQ
ncbi:MAG: lytic murein transglycosylase, partial [bacterium]|nr:lytic murein transglycosylase [bacterium]